MIDLKEMIRYSINCVKYFIGINKRPSFMKRKNILNAFIFGNYGNIHQYLSYLKWKKDKYKLLKRMYRNEA